MSLSYRQFAAELGSSVTEAAIKKWPHRKKFPADVARQIVTKARERGLSGVTLEWVLWGEGQGPKNGAKRVPHVGAAEGLPTHEQHRPLAEGRLAAPQTDLDHNAFG